MADPIKISAAEAAKTTDCAIGRPEGERLGTVLRNVLIHRPDTIEVDFSGVQALTPSGASLMLYRVLSVDPDALSRVVFSNVPEHLKAVLQESLAGVRESLVDRN